MKLVNNTCEICGKPKGRYFDHRKCSKMKQKLQTFKDVKPRQKRDSGYLTYDPRKGGVE